MLGCQAGLALGEYPGAPQRFLFVPSEVLQGRNLTGMLLSIFSHGDAAHLAFDMVVEQGGASRPRRTGAILPSGTSRPAIPPLPRIPSSRTTCRVDRIAARRREAWGIGVLGTVLAHVLMAIADRPHLSLDPSPRNPRGTTGMSTITDRSEIREICTSCNHADGCNHRDRGPIWNCEDFDDSGPAFLEPSLGEKQAWAQAMLAAVATTDRVTLGICSNCVELPTCGLPRATGGVWHCEQYV